MKDLFKFNRGFIIRGEKTDIARPFSRNEIISIYSLNTVYSKLSIFESNQIRIRIENEKEENLFSRVVSYEFLDKENFHQELKRLRAFMNRK
jgi:hypothetical protein